MDRNLEWQPPAVPPPAPKFDRPKPRRPWLPAAIIGAAIVVAGALIAGALLIKSKGSGSTCQAWKDTQQTLRAIPALPDGWTWTTPNIDADIANQNGPVGRALDAFEPRITAEPANVARAANDYVAARRKQIQSLTDHTYTAADGQAVDSTLTRLDKLCDIKR